MPYMTGRRDGTAEKLNEWFCYKYDLKKGGSTDRYAGKVVDEPRQMTGEGGIEIVEEKRVVWCILRIWHDLSLSDAI